MSAVDRIKKLLDSDRKIRELEALCGSLSAELNQASQSEMRLELRVANVEAALERMIRMFGNQWIGPEERVIIRTCKAILEDAEWRNRSGASVVDI